MEQVERIDTVKQYNSCMGVDTLHPLVSVVNFNEMPAIQYFRRYMGIYAVFLKNINVETCDMDASHTIMKTAH